jgi:hypothetical protein
VLQKGHARWVSGVDSLNLAGSSGQYWGYFWVMLIQEQPPHRVAWTLEAGSWPCMVIRAQRVWLLKYFLRFSKLMF